MLSGLCFVLMVRPVRPEGLRPTVVNNLSVYVLNAISNSTGTRVPHRRVQLVAQLPKAPFYSASL